MPVCSTLLFNPETSDDRSTSHTKFRLPALLQKIHSYANHWDIIWKLLVTFFFEEQLSSPQNRVGVSTYKPVETKWNWGCLLSRLFHFSQERILHFSCSTSYWMAKVTFNLEGVRRDFGARLECHAPLSKPEKRIAKYFSFILNPLGSQIILHIHFVFCIASPALSELLSLDGSPLASCRFMKQLVLTERQPTHWAQS